MDMHISRDARRVLSTLQSISKIDTQNIEDLWVAERLVYSFFPKIIIGHIERFYNPKSKNKPWEIAFYEKPTRSQNFGRRRDDNWEHSDEKMEIWRLLSEYVLTDYSYDDLVLIKDSNISIEDIKYGIKIGIGEKVYAIPYAIRVAERHKAERDKQKENMQNRRGLFDYTDINSDIERRGRLEIATNVASWQEEMENLRLKKKVEELHRKGW